ncbi:MAG TPA: hypothetical protein VGP79_14300 [Bryobacteraceae bacterium]|nr:hypothetical protein [Bryobacteraceae bacterium]
MRCLYCGKELALLKRWTGGGEFCSDAHRQRYQEEYNDLALKRLLQSQPAEAPADLKSRARSKGDADLSEVRSKVKPEVKPEPSIHTQPEPRPAPTPEPVREPVYAAHPQRENAPKRPAVAVADPPKVGIAEPAVEKPVVKEVVAPAPLGGLIREVPALSAVEATDVARADLEWIHTAAPEFPLRASGQVNFSDLQLCVCEPLTFELSGRFRDYESAPRDRRLEIREFVRPVPIVEVKLGGAEETVLEMPMQPLEIVISPHVPVESAVLWQDRAREFAPPEVDLGELARLVFGTTGLEDNHEVEGSAAEAIAPAVAPVDASVETALQPEAVAAPEPVAPVEVVAEPEKASAAEPEAEHAAEPVSSAMHQAIPELVHRSVPLTLHGLAAGRGKSVQIFTSPLASGINVQLPRSTALPLRPLMVLGPRLTSTQVQTTPAVPPPADPKPESKPDLKADLKKAAPPARQDPRANGKKSKPGVRVITQPELPPSEPTPAKSEPPKAEPRPEGLKTETKRAEPVQPAVAKPDSFKKPEISQIAAKSLPPAPTSALPVASLTSPDLGLPSLGLASSQSPWSRLSSRARIGVAAAVALLLAGIVMIMAKGGGSPARAEGPRVVEAGPALPITESGWITNWAAGEPGVRKTRDMSVLRASLNLTDYRVDLQGQIESKGMGWIVRAMNAKNFCVLRLEIIKPGLEPVVNFVRFATVGGEEESRLSLRLPFPVRIDTMYKIRTEVVGSTITTWIQDQKIDTWTNEHVKTGGAGLYYERGERASLKGGLNVVPLTLKN